MKNKGIKSSILTLIFALLITIIASAKGIQKNHYTSLNDTLLLKTEKIKGYGQLPNSMYGIEFLNPKDRNYFPLIYPKNISDLKIACELIDFKPYWFTNLKKSKSEYLSTFLKDYFPNKIDTTRVPSIKDNSISIMSGRMAGKRIFIVDQNNNKDFTDDSIRPYRKLDIESISHLIRCKYNIFNGEESAKDSGWVNIGTDASGILSISVAHHLEANFTIDENKYKIAVVNGHPFNRFCFENPIFSLSTQNEVKKDSLSKNEMFETGELIKLGRLYYRLEDISNDGHYITLIKDNDIKNKIGTQVGFIAPDFSCRTMENRAISLKDYKGKYLLLANVTAQRSPVMSYEYYKELTKTYGSKVEILCIDDSPDDLEKNIVKFDLTGKFMIAEGNQSIKKNYRKDTSSRTCFLINPEGRIADKFDISQWNQNLKSYFENH